MGVDVPTPPAHGPEAGSAGGRRRGVATRERIVAAAADLFAQHGYDAASVGAIAQAAGIAAPSMYKHFPSKHAVLLAVVERAIENSEAVRGVAVSNDLPSSLAAVFAEYLAPPNSAHRRLTVELSREAIHEPEIAVALADFNAELRSLLAATIGEAHPMVEPVECELLAHLILLLMMGAMHFDTLDRDRLGDTALIEFLAGRFAVLLADPNRSAVDGGPNTAASAGDDGWSGRSSARSVRRAKRGDELLPSDGRLARSVKTRRRILDAAAELFALHGYENTSTTAIADAVGITVPGMYRHLTSKADLFVEVAERAFDGYQSAMRSTATGPEPGVAALVRALSRFSLAEGRAARRLVIEVDFGAWRDDDIALARRSSHVEMRDRLAGILTELDGVAPRDASYAATLALMMFNGVAHLDTLDPTLIDDPRWEPFLGRRLPQLLGCDAAPSVG